MRGEGGVSPWRRAFTPRLSVVTNSTVPAHRTVQWSGASLIYQALFLNRKKTRTSGLGHVILRLPTSGILDPSTPPLDVEGGGGV